MAGFTTYVTTGGETWSLVAYRAYGDQYAIKAITDANPDVAITPLLPGGITLKIPIKDVEVNSVDVSLLPPWKR